MALIAWNKESVVNLCFECLVRLFRNMKGGATSVMGSQWRRRSQFKIAVADAVKCHEPAFCLQH